MPATTPLYDLVLLLDLTAEDARRDEIVATVRETISADGELATTQDWGPRQMAFEIRHRKDAHYHLLQFHGPPALLERLDRQLRILDEVLRFRIVKLAPGTPPPPEERSDPRPQSAAPDDVAEVVATDDATTEAVEAETPEADAAPVETDAPAAEADDAVAAAEQA